MNVPVTFVERAHKGIGHSSTAAGEVGARRMMSHRIAAGADYPAMEEMRDQARRIRLYSLGHLDELLGRFSDEIEGAGGFVHFAADADEAIAHIRRIADEKNVRRIVKSKSMVTEEIRLNAALEAHGLEVVETDLGEFIVQLSGDRPSHIIAPVMHKTRQEVGELFHDKLGIEYTDDPTELNNAARNHLREIFLSADMGISGCNVAIAESGSVVLVTNEGNGRLTTSAPRIHVAVMGLERIVPTLSDAAVILEVLARSATGQRLSVYTNFVTGARRPGDPDGPEEFHVVILDNGRSRVLAGDTAEILACIRCGACLNVCPVYREAGGHAYGFTYSGPIGAVITPSLMGMAEWHDLPYASSLCGACLDACPVRIDLPGLLLKLRRDAVRDGFGPDGLERALKWFTRLATNPPMWRGATRAGGWGAKLIARRGWIKSLPGRGSAWTDHRDLPAPAAKPFHARWEERRREA
ncbi:MAG TPA: LutB/LldF family L-lactate oxidation iron-sulfur protein [Acidimicrobiia bacterium]|nr:LutB/LldF family L-lactate oxidation iron-sulfur protein [Acidimicrobiia bacterium]